MIPKKVISQIDKNCAILVKKFRFKKMMQKIFLKKPRSDLWFTSLIFKPLNYDNIQPNRLIKTISINFL